MGCHWWGQRRLMSAGERLAQTPFDLKSASTLQKPSKSARMFLSSQRLYSPTVSATTELANCYRQARKSGVQNFPASQLAALSRGYVTNTFWITNAPTKRSHLLLQELVFLPVSARMICWLCKDFWRVLVFRSKVMVSRTSVVLLLGVGGI